MPTSRYHILRDGRLYDSSAYRSIAIGLAREWQRTHGGRWSVTDSAEQDASEYIIEDLKPETGVPGGSE